MLGIIRVSVDRVVVGVVSPMVEMTCMEMMTMGGTSNLEAVCLLAIGMAYF